MPDRLKLRPTKARELAEERGWLSQTPPAFRRAVLDRAVLRTFKAGAPIQRAGDEAGGIHGLLSGRVRVFHTSAEQGSLLVHIFHPGAWFGESPTIVGKYRLVGVTAAGPAELLYVSRHGINEMTRADPDSWRLFAQPLVHHLETALGAVSDLMMRDDTKRFVAVLLRLGGCRLASSRPDLPIVEASQEELASMANLARNTVGAILRRLETAGLIRLDYGRVTILQQDRLRAMLANAASEC